MIGRLRGDVAWRDGNQAIIDVNGVGYAVSAPGRTLDAWMEAGGEVTAIISTQVREDAITLFAFESFEERAVFLVLLSVNKVGAKLALGTLDALDPGSLVRAVETDDVATLCRIPGVGKRTAQRLALELKGKLPAAALTPAAARSAVPVDTGPDAFDLALTRLGWTRAEVEAARIRVSDAGLDDAPVGARVRAALQTSLQA
jgi:Holliday junction DNA helicase RuvA